jgi:dephospho-CoA kinase
LGRIAFSSEENTEKLNSVVHPPLLKELERRVKQAKRKYELIVVDAALLVYWNWQKKVDLTILVHAGREIRFKRLLTGGLTIEEIRMRTESQLPYRHLRAAADVVIYNNSTLKCLEGRIKRLLKKIV